MFAMEDGSACATTNSSSDGDQGVFVKVTQGGLNDGPVVYDSTYTDYLGMDATKVPYVGRDQYPRVITEVGVAASGENAIGVTLYQTAKADENEQKLLYYPQKKLETQSVLPGESVPVLSRGIITVSADAGTDYGAQGINLDAEIAGSTDVIGLSVGIDAANDGVLAIATAHSDDAFGKILATGSRSIKADQNPDQFIGDPPAAGSPAGQGTGHYAIVQFDTTHLS